MQSPPANTQPHSPQAHPPKPAMPKTMQWVLRITGVTAILLFLTPSFFVVKYFAIDSPQEISRLKGLSSASPQKKSEILASTEDDNVLAMAQVAQIDAEAEWRKRGITSLCNLLASPGFRWRRPVETLRGKAALAEIATHDKDSIVRTQAGLALNSLARQGVVIRR